MLYPLASSSFCGKGGVGKTRVTRTGGHADARTAEDRASSPLHRGAEGKSGIPRVGAPRSDTRRSHLRSRGLGRGSPDPRCRTSLVEYLVKHGMKRISKRPQSRALRSTSFATAVCRNEGHPVREG